VEKEVIMTDFRLLRLPAGLFLGLQLLVLWAPDALSQMSTVHLDEVVIAAEAYQRYSVGNKTTPVDSLKKALYARSNLSDILLQTTSIQLREYGSGMLSSISFRGSGPAHTALLWQGINLNSMTLGQSDFSQYQVFMFDEIDIQFGGASSLNGSDAIGGSIHLINRPRWKPGWNLQAQQEVASFGGTFSGLKLRTGNGRIESKTRLYHRALRNDFPYTQRDRNGEEFTVRQENAGIRAYGLMQEFAGRLGQRSWIALHLWHQGDERGVQPQMVSAPGQKQGGEEIANRNSRLLAELHHHAGIGYFNFSTAYLADHQVYNAFDSIRTGRWISQFAFEGDAGNRFQYRTGAQFQRVQARARAFSGTVYEWRADYYASGRYMLRPQWDLTLNLRKAWAPSLESPLAPSLASTYRFRLPSAEITIRAMAERSFRIPTFNDRYWRDQGRIDLLPEQGYSTELGALWQRKSGNSGITLDLAGYYMNIRDWIIWQPVTFLSDRNGDGIEEQVSDWRPFNQKKVRGMGVELGATYLHTANNWSMGGGAQLAFQRTVLTEGLDDRDPAVGQQLPYTPRLRYSLSAHIGYLGWSLDVVHYYTGRRTTQDLFYDVLDDYALTNVSAGKSLVLFRQHLNLSGGVRNAANVAYQNMKRYAMPGRNYYVCLRFDISGHN
jgi:vitamin B12 transporter